MDLTIRLIVISTIIITVTDVLEYIYIKQNPEKLTIKFLIQVIIVTVVPLAINIWFHTRIQKISKRNPLRIKKGIQRDDFPLLVKRNK